MPYIGGTLSTNAYKFKTRCTKPEVKAWIQILSKRVRALAIPQRQNYNIVVSYFFRDERHPDLDNLHKVIGDGLKVGMGVNDKYFKWRDENVFVGTIMPKISIVIEWQE